MSRLLLPLVVLILAACAAPPREAPVLRSEAPLALQGTVLNGSATWPAAQWWQRYDDAVLSQLVERAIGGAPRIAMAGARIAGAREQVRLAGAARGVQVDLNAQFEHQRLSDNGLLPTDFLGFNWYSQSDLGIAVRYQLDWWGKQRAGIEAAVDRARATEAEQRAAVVALAAAVAQEYFGWQADGARLALLRQRLALLQSEQQLTARRIAARLEPADQLRQIDRQQAAMEEMLAQLQTSQRLRIVALAALTGGDATTLPALVPHPLPRIAAALPDRVGIDLLARRPEIVASRWRVAAATRDSDAIRASYYPDISLRALAALSSIELGELLETGSAAPRLGVALNLPIFDAGLRDARHGTARAALAEAVGSYNQAVIDAARELGTAVQRADAAATQQVLRERAREATAALVASAHARVARGLTHRGPALAAQSALLAAQDSLIQTDFERVVADIQLTVALGGGYLEQEHSSP